MYVHTHPKTGKTYIFWNIVQITLKVSIIGLKLLS